MEQNDVAFLSASGGSRHADMLRQSVAVATEQHRKMQVLADTIDATEKRSLDALDAHTKEMTRVVDENKALRLELTHLSAEVQALTRTESVTETTLATLRQRLANVEATLSEREAELDQLRPASTHFPRENAKLQQENQELRNELETLKSKMATLAPMKRLDEYQRQLRDVQQDLARHQAILRVAHANQEAATLTERNNLLLETRALEQSVTANHQREELRKLHRIIDALNREKALVPPTILALPGPIAGLLKGPEIPPTDWDTRVLSRDDMLRLLTTLARVEDFQQQFAQQEGNMGGLALQQLRVIEELSKTAADLMRSLENVAGRQLELLEKDLSAMERDTGLFNLSRVFHIKLSPQELHLAKFPREALRYKRRLAGVRAGEICIFEVDEPSLPIHKLEAWKTSVSLDKDNLRIVLKYRPLPSQPPEVHLIRFDSPDAFNRWYHGLKYGGFLPPDVPKAPVKKAEKRAAPAPVVESRQPLALVLSPSGQGPGRRKMPFVMEDRAVRFDVRVNNVVIPMKEGDPLVFDAENARCVIDPNMKEFYVYYTEPDDPTGPPCKLLIKPNTHEDFNAFLPDALHMRWKSVVVGTDKEPPPPPKKEELPPKKEEPPPPPPPVREQPPASEALFIVENRQIRLYEHEGDPEPVLVLHADDCVAHANDREREIIVTNKEGTRDEETYAFNFDTAAIYDDKKQKLLENGFFDKKRKVTAEAEQRVNQVCVVQKGRMDMYRHYGSPGDVPLLTMIADRTEAYANEERREIRLIQHKTDGKVEKATLDCSTRREFDRWTVALLFGGFLKSADPSRLEQTRGLSHLTKYIFPINLFGPAEDDPRCVRVNKDCITLFPTPNATEPIMVFNRNDIEVEAELPPRRFKIFRNRNKETEDRCDIIMHLATEFDRLKKILEAAEYLQPASEAPTRKLLSSNDRFILAKKMSLSVFPNKRKTRPSLFLRGLDYIGEVSHDTRIVTIRPRAPGEENKSSDAQAEVDGGATLLTPEERLQLPTHSFEVKSEADRRRWAFAFFVSRLNDQIPDAPRFFLPTLIYGFNSRDIVVDEPIGRGRSGSFVGSFFGLRRGGPGSQSSFFLQRGSRRESIAAPKVPRFRPMPSDVKKSRKVHKAVRPPPRKNPAATRNEPVLRCAPPSTGMTSVTTAQQTVDIADALFTMYLQGSEESDPANNISEKYRHFSVVQQDWSDG